MTAPKPSSSTLAAPLTASERRAARKAGTLRDFAPRTHAADGTFTPYGERKHARSMERWARRYDALNGAPESESDR